MAAMMRNQRLLLIAVWCTGTVNANAAVLDATADAVLGQSGFTANSPNQPDGLPEANNLAFDFAPHVAVALDGRLYVSDSHNNRVLSWPDAASFTNGQSADLVVGQPNFKSDTPNNGGVSASSLFPPQGLAVDDTGNLWVTDAFNHRVLKFNSPATTDLVADLVIGQPDFTSSDQNLGLGEKAARADSLNYPGRVLVHGVHVYVADSGNSRVLHYTNPTVDQPSADRVFGQFGDFTAPFKNNDGTGTCANPDERGCGPPSADNLFNPIGLALDPAGSPEGNGSLYVADWINNRILRFDRPVTSDTTADAVYGQTDFASFAANSGGLAKGLNMPADIAVDSFGRLLIADSANNRVLVYRDPFGVQPIASLVFGQLGSLTTNSPNHGLGESVTDAEGLFGPTGLITDAAGNLYVVDANNSRVLRFDEPLPTRIPADIDDDDDIDLDDFTRLLGCLRGPAAGLVHPRCARADGNKDGVVDLRDVAGLARCFVGSGVPGELHCAD